MVIIRAEPHHLSSLNSSAMGPSNSYLSLDRDVSPVPTGPTPCSHSLRVTMAQSYQFPCSWVVMVDAFNWTSFRVLQRQSSGHVCQGISRKGLKSRERSDMPKVTQLLREQIYFLSELHGSLRVHTHSRKGPVHTEEKTQVHSHHSSNHGPALCPHVLLWIIQDFHEG